MEPDSSGLRFHWRRTKGGLGFGGEEGRMGRRTNAELGAEDECGVGGGGGAGKKVER